MTAAHGRPAHPRVPPLGGFNPTVLRIELRRMLRNRRTVIFTLVFPAACSSRSARARLERRGGHGNVAAYIMISMALYGAALTTAGGGRWSLWSERWAGAASSGSRRSTRRSTS